MKTASFSPTINDATRERIVIIVCAFAAIGLGIVAASRSIELTRALFIILFFGSAAFILPRAWLGIVLIGLIPLQFYFPITASFYLRGALVFVFAATLRVALLRLAQRDWRSLPWAIPAGLFISVAMISAIGASNRYAAFKGIYDWLPIFAAAFVVGETMQSVWLKRAINGLVIAGIAEAILGWLQTWFSPTQMAEALQTEASQWFYQPNLVRERLADFSFNWVLANRVLPFGTFINGIDYALFLAAVLALALGGLLSARKWIPGAWWWLCVAFLGSVLLQTYKGSGVLALAGAGAIWMWTLGVERGKWKAEEGRRVADKETAYRLLLAACGLLGVVLLLGVIFFEPIVHRGAFLIQREAGNSYETGRLELWRQALAALPQRPCFGFGLNNADQLVAPTQSLRGATFIVVSNSLESAYVATLVETGICGLAALGWLIGVIFMRAYQRVRCSMKYAGILAAIVALLSGNLTVSGLTTDQNGLLLGVLIGMVFAQNDGAKD